MATVQLIRKRVSIPDEGLSLQVVFQDTGNPLLDESGNPILTAEPDEQGNPIPEYPEFVESVQIPADITPDQATLESLISSVEPNALARAYARADSIAIKVSLIPIIEAINSGD